MRSYSKAGGIRSGIKKKAPKKRSTETAEGGVNAGAVAATGKAEEGGDEL
jgi:hypothetical protein